MSNGLPTAPGKPGILVLNLGTPDSTSVPDVRRYLREFLSDPRVIDINPVGRWLLLNLIILPLHPRRSAEAYKEVWTDAGSPLLVHGNALVAGLQARFGDEADVRLGMRYGSPSVADVLDGFAADGIDRIFAVPLFPQWASATSGSAIAKVMTVAAERWSVPQLQFVGPFFDDPGYIEAMAELARPLIEGADHVIFSFHGVPERHVHKADRGGARCLASADCCAAIGPENRGCYRAQCFATGRALGAALGLVDDAYTTAFQSRFGRDPWIQPFTDERIEELGRAKAGRIAVVEPGFLADCLETTEEIGIRGREQFREAGGGELVLVPCVNASPTWVAALEAIIRRECAWLTSP